MGVHHLIKPDKFSLKDLNLQVRLETCNGDAHYDLTGRKTFTVEFFKKGVGFGITDIQIEINPSLQPVVEITFKDLFGNTIYGTQNEKFTDSDGATRSIDYSILFNWPPPKFILTFKGYLGKPVTWILSLKKHDISFDSSDGSQMIKCSFVPNQWGFFADLPFLYLLAVKSLKKAKNDNTNIETIFDYIKIGKQVEVKTKEKTREFDGLLNQLGAIKNNVSGAIMDSKVVSWDTLIDGEVNGQKVVGFTPIKITRPPGITDEQIKSYQTKTGTLEKLNTWILFHAGIFGNIPSGGVESIDISNSNVQNQIKGISDVLDKNIKAIDEEIKRRVYDSSSKQLATLTIGSVFSKLAGDSAYLIGRIIQSGVEGYNAAEIERKQAQGKTLIGKHFPLIIEEGRQVPAVGYEVDKHEGAFVQEFIRAVTEGITSNKNVDGASEGATTQDEDSLVQRINNLEILNSNPYKPSYERIASSVLVRSGIAGFITRSGDPNLPGDYAGGVWRAGIDRDSITNIQTLADNDFKNISDNVISSLPDSDLLKLKRFTRFWDNLLTDDGEGFKNFNGDKINVPFKLTNTATISNQIKDYLVVMENEPSDIDLNDQEVLEELKATNNQTVTIERVGDFVSRDLMDLMRFENAKFIYEGFENTLSLQRMVHYGVPYLIKNQFFSNDDYYLVMFEGEDVDKITSTNTAPTDTEFSTGDKDGSFSDVGQREPVGIIPINSYKDNGKVLGRIEIINEYIKQERVLDYKKLREGVSDLQQTENGEFISGFTQMLWTKRIVEQVGNSTTETLPGKLAYTIYTQNDGSPYVWDLFYGGDNRGINQRVYLKRICRNILDKIRRIEEQRSQAIGNVLGRATEQYNMIYQQMHNIFHQWNVLAFEGPGKKAHDICKTPTILPTFADDLERMYSGCTNASDMSREDPGNGQEHVSFVFDYPLNDVIPDKKPINVKESLINIDPLYNPNANTTVLNIISNICTKNNFIFVPIAGNADYRSIKEVYKPYPGIIKEPKIGNYFHVIFAPTPEDRTHISNSGVGGGNSSFLSIYQERLDKLNTDALAVEFGGIDNNVIKNITLSSNETKTTAESIVNLQRLVDNENRNKVITMDCSVLPVMEGRSYKASVETLGNGQIYPFQYFFIENQPMFGGLYQIMKVKHNISPNNMTTNFEGIRMRFSSNSYGGIEPITLDSLRALGTPIDAIPANRNQDDAVLQTTVGYNMSGEQTQQGAILQGRSYVNREDEQVRRMLSSTRSYKIDYSNSTMLPLVKASNLNSKLDSKEAITYDSTNPVYDEAFLNRVDRMVDSFYELGFGVPGQVILAKIHHESAGTYCPYIVNRVGYMGLIQFNLTEKLIWNMFGTNSVVSTINKGFAQSNIDQLDQVEAYMKYWLTTNKRNFQANKFPVDGNGKIMIDAATVYCITFLPAFAYKGLDVDLAVEWERLGRGKTKQGLIKSNPSLSPDGVTIPKHYLATVLERSTKYSLRNPLNDTNANPGIQA